MKELLIDFGKSIAAILKQKNISQDDLARKLSEVQGKKIQRQYVNRIINGRTNLTMKTIHNIMTALDMNLILKIENKNK